MQTNLFAFESMWCVCVCVCVSFNFYYYYNCTLCYDDILGVFQDRF